MRRWFWIVVARDSCRRTEDWLPGSCVNIADCARARRVARPAGFLGRNGHLEVFYAATLGVAPVGRPEMNSRFGLGPVDVVEKVVRSTRRFWSPCDFSIQNVYGNGWLTRLAYRLNGS